MLLWVSAN